MFLKLPKFKFVFKIRMGPRYKQFHNSLENLRISIGLIATYFYSLNYHRAIKAA